MVENTKRASHVMAELDALGSPEKAAHLAGFFKTGPGQYGEGDQFIGVRVPEQRRVAKNYTTLPLEEIDHLLTSPIHEYRLTGLILLIDQYDQGGAAVRQTVVNFYLARLTRVNNWDLVDLSAPKILGDHLLHHPQNRKMLSSMARSNLLWERRVAVVATWPLIKQGQFAELLTLAHMLLTDTQDLMHKAVGWMLREVGKVDPTTLEAFLEQHAGAMPRTMLRYAIERLEPQRRQHFMAR